MNEAKKGKIQESAFTIFESTTELVKADMGEPDKVDQAGEGFYATYEKKQVVFGYNIGGEIFDIRSYSPKLHEITEEVVKHSYGEPDVIRKVNDESIYVYKVGANVELKIIISNQSKVIDHVSVYNPQRIEAIAYLLDIKGESPHLSKKSWESMMKWRKEIVEFSKGQNHMYMNGPNVKKVALTFDDGPDSTVTPGIINVLDRYKVKGNFFFLGSQINQYPEVVKEAYDRGHLVLSHTYNHIELTKIGREEIRKEIKDTGEAIKSIIGKEPAILRTPYGSTNQEVADAVRSEEYSIVLWSIDSLDWAQKDPDVIVDNVVNHIRNGDIILMHSDSDEYDTYEALPTIIEALQNQGYEIVDLETLLGVKAYK
nr:polysaccharide deacetylase family protein [Fredinandcohnia sp. SECRCQ15]